MGWKEGCFSLDICFCCRSGNLGGELSQRYTQVPWPMPFVLIGVNHKSAPVEVRERLAIPESRRAEAIARVVKFPCVEEGMILSTCNRVELIANVNSGTLDLRGFLREYFGTDTDLLADHLYEYREQEAMRHIFRVAASLDSMIVGEPQVLGQVKPAYAVASA